MDFGKALEALKNGKQARRKEWKNNELFVSIQDCRLAAIGVEPKFGELPTYSLNSRDILSNDWEIRSENG